MESKIIVDSCVDFNDGVFHSSEKFERVPFIISIDDQEMVDVNLETSSLLAKMKASKNKILTSCPSPHDFLAAFQKQSYNFVVTISSKLSGSYNSAIVAKDMLENDGPSSKSFVHVFGSKSASAGQNLVALKLKQLIEDGLPSTQIIEKVNHYIEHLKVLFVLNSLDNLAKSGRVSQLTAKVGSLMNIVPIMGNDDGVIKLKEKVRGAKKAFRKLIDLIGEDVVDYKNTILSITYVTAREKAEALKHDILAKYPFKDVLLFKSGGLSTVYADDGGLIVAY